MIEEDYVLTSETLYATLENVRNMIEAILTVWEDNKIGLVTDDKVEKKAINLFKEDLKNSLSRYVYQTVSMVEEIAAKAIHLRYQQKY